MLSTAHLFSISFQGRDSLFWTLCIKKFLALEEVQFGLGLCHRGLLVACHRELENSSNRYRPTVISNHKTTLRFALFWGFTQGRIVSFLRIFRDNISETSHHEGSSSLNCLTFKDGMGRLCQNVGKELPSYAA